MFLRNYSKQPHKFTYLKFEKAREQSQYTNQRYFVTVYRLKPLKVRVDLEQMDQHILTNSGQDFLVYLCRLPSRALNRRARLAN